MTPYFAASLYALAYIRPFDHHAPDHRHHSANGGNSRGAACALASSFIAHIASDVCHVRRNSLVQDSEREFSGLLVIRLTRGTRPRGACAGLDAAATALARWLNTRRKKGQ